MHPYGCNFYFFFGGRLKYGIILHHWQIMVRFGGLIYVFIKFYNWLIRYGTLCILGYIYTFSSIWEYVLDQITMASIVYTYAGLV